MNAYREAYPKRRAYHRPVVTCLGTEKDMKWEYGDPKDYTQWAKCEPLKFEAAHLRAVGTRKRRDQLEVPTIPLPSGECVRATEKPRPHRFTWQRIAWALAIGSAVGVKVWMWLQ